MTEAMKVAHDNALTEYRKHLQSLGYRSYEITTMLIGFEAGWTQAVQTQGSLMLLDAINTQDFCCTPDSGDCCGPGSWCCSRAGKHTHEGDSNVST